MESPELQSYEVSKELSSIIGAFSLCGIHLAITYMNVFVYKKVFYMSDHPEVEKAFAMLNSPPKPEEPIKIWIVTVLDSYEQQVEVFSFFTEARTDEEAVKMAQEHIDEFIKCRQDPNEDHGLSDYEQKVFQEFQEESDPVEKLRIFNRWGIGFYIECFDSDVQK